MDISQANFGRIKMEGFLKHLINMVFFFFNNFEREEIGIESFKN